ncbi:hypothetical protein [Rhodococcus marinonascens]|uniref:hypothetical protein n=1 Tax=Rhodococcus marinonascens TaxID=38311 RepID=UPI001475CF0E|nr:hypothetical protein [Rhodococcus marinonascens]
MFWKIVLAVAVIWIALAVVGALTKALFSILVISAVVFGLYLLFKAMSGSGDKSDVTRR